MSIRRQCSVPDEAWAKLKALSFLTDRPAGEVIAIALERYLAHDKTLAAKVQRVLETR